MSQSANVRAANKTSRVSLKDIQPGMLVATSGEVSAQVYTVAHAYDGGRVVDLTYPTKASPVTSAGRMDYGVLRHPSASQLEAYRASLKECETEQEPEFVPTPDAVAQTAAALSRYFKDIPEASVPNKGVDVWAPGFPAALVHKIATARPTRVVKQEKPTGLVVIDMKGYGSASTSKGRKAKTPSKPVASKKAAKTTKTQPKVQAASKAPAPKVKAAKKAEFTPMQAAILAQVRGSKGGKLLAFTVAIDTAHRCVMLSLCNKGLLVLTGDCKTGFVNLAK